MIQIEYNIMNLTVKYEYIQIEICWIII